MAGLGGAFGLQILLRNLEAAAEGAASPPRLLITHWPLGTARQRFLPTGDRTNFQFSPILAPFEAAGLRDDLIVLYGLSTASNRCPGGGSYEAGTVFATTGANSEGTRQNGGEADDAVAGGPSFDQIFLRHAPDLARPGVGYINTIGDARVASHETSACCLSYGYERRQIQSASPGGLIGENVPLLPTLSPFTAYASLFSGFMPGATEPSAALKALLRRKSVLDSALRELARLRTIAPASQREKIDLHAEAIRNLENALQAQINASAAAQACGVPLAPSKSLVGKNGSTSLELRASAADNQWFEEVGKLHLSVIRAAFQCDLIRVATFQWCAASNDIAFEGFVPSDPEQAYRHYAMLNTGKSALSDFWSGPPPTTPGPDQDLYEFFCNAQTWFHQKTVDALLEFKTARDVFGGSLLDHTIVPFITDLVNRAGGRSPLPALIVGGKALGMVGGQFLNLSPSLHHNAMWLSIAQALLRTDRPQQALAEEAFMLASTAPSQPIEGLWRLPQSGNP